MERICISHWQEEQLTARQAGEKSDYVQTMKNGVLDSTCHVELRHDYRSHRVSTQYL
jgi:hypothetical protein